MQGAAWTSLYQLQNYVSDNVEKEMLLKPTAFDKDADAVPNFIEIHKTLGAISFSDCIEPISN